MTTMWRKLGLVYCANGQQPWARSRAYCPTPILIDGGSKIRVLCAFLDDRQIGRCGWVDVETADPTRVVDVSQHPILDIGQPGTFDEHGVTPLSIVDLGEGRVRLYYAGWQLGTGVRYLLFTGAAESYDDGVTFTRLSEAPVLDRADGELHVRSSGLVLRDGESWRMWYGGGTGWQGSGRSARPRYALRHITSLDGMTWPRSGEICFEPRDDESGFGRPCIVRDDDLYEMWYGRRSLSGAYQLGYATSQDGIRWERDDESAGLLCGEPGEWDSEMVGLASLIDTPSGRYLFYNGNNYGATGFGIAVAEQS